MVVNDLHDPGVLNAIHGLGFLVVIHQDQHLPLGPQKVPPGDHALVSAVFVQDGEIPVPFAGHHILDLVNDIILVKGHQVVGLHKIADGHTLVHQTGNGICIVGGGDNRAAPLLGQLFDGHGHSRALADNDAGRLHLNGAQLGLIPVAQNDQIIFINIIFH